MAPVGDQTVNEGDTVSLTVGITDLDGESDAPDFSLATAPAGATIGETTGQFQWVTSEANGPGVFAVTVEAVEGGFTSSTTFEITVDEIDTPPELTAVSNQTVAANSEFRLTVTATDVDLPANPLTFSATAPGGGNTARLADF